jgi:predicted permease
MLGSLAHLKIALRRLRATPAFTVAAFATLALAVGALTATFSVTDALLLRPLPYPQSERLVVVGHAVPGFGFPELPFSMGTFDLTRREQRSFADFAIYYDADRYNVGLENPERVPAVRVSPAFFDVFRSSPDPGRPFNDDDSRPGAAPVVVVSHDLWQRRWGGDAALVGRTIHVEGVDREVVGVAPRGFQYPDRRTGMWIPFTIDPSNLVPAAFGYPGVARLAPDVTIEAAQDEVRTINARVSEVYPDNLPPQWVERGGFDSWVRPLADQVVGDVRTEVWLVFGTAALLLLLAAANVANLFLVRTQGRRREFAIRSAVGSGRRGLIVPSLAESLVIGVASGAAGVALGALLVRVGTRLAPPDLPRLSEIGLSPTAIVIGIGSAVIAGVVFALLPMASVAGGSVQAALHSGGAGSTGNRAARRLQRVLVANQAALAVALLAGAGLLARSFGSLTAVDPGFDPGAVTTFEIGLPANEYDGAERARAFQEIEDRIARVAGVEAVGAGEFLPLVSDFRKGPLHVEGEELPEGESGPIVDLKRVTPGYFAALGIPLLEGRNLDRDDGPEAFAAVLADRTLVDRHLGEGQALGRRVRLTERGEYSELVGVVGSVRGESFRDEPLPFLYFPAGTTTPSSTEVPASMGFAVRSDLPSERLVPALVEAVATIDPRLPLGSLRPMQDVVDEHLARDRFITWVLAGMALTGLVLAAVGVYGVIAYVAVSRRKEFGVRLALGEPPARVFRGIVAGGLGVVAVGAAIGLVLALAGGRVLEGVLFGVTTTDLVALALAPSLVLATALLASFSPAWRASRQDASAVLRED